MLTVKQIEAAQFGVASDRLADGNGLYVRLSKGGAKTFQLRMTIDGKSKWITLGQFPHLSLKDARMQSMLKRAEILDPSPVARDTSFTIGLRELPNDISEPPLFRDLAKVWFDKKVLGLSNGKHIQQNWSTLVTYVFPQIGDMRVNEIKLRHIIAVFDPIWRVKHTTAKRTLGRVREVFELAKLQEFVEVNPTEFDQKTAFGRVNVRTRHQPSLDWSRAPDLWQWILDHDVVEDVRQMMMIMVLTGKRTKEVRMMQWGDIDRENLIWTSQVEHMKMRRGHRVPICRQLDIVFNNLELLKCHSKNVLARPKNKSGVIDENRARLEFQKFDPNITGHGMRSTFRTWLRKQNRYQTDMMETSLSHEKDQLVASYMRDDLLDERRPMMQDWADYVTVGLMPTDLREHL